MANQMLGYSCQICNIVCSGPENLAQHMISIKHEKKKRQASAFNGITTSAPALAFNGIATSAPAQPGAPSNLWCEICEIHTSGIESYLAHMKGQPHAKKVNRRKMLQMMQESGDLPQPLLQEANVPVQTSSSNALSNIDNVSAAVNFLSLNERSLFFCDICQVNFSGPENAQQHYDGSQHRKKINKQQILSGAGASSSCGLSTSGISGQLSVPEITPIEITEISDDENATLKLREIFEEGKTKVIVDNFDD